ncbi:MAG: HlyD family efflux transporter periplasmic adaptor subunit [Bacteroidales bacterium]|nr:HlyD family efflux transporter periplasmic adaptor subunit [Bacteroidales bacterium]HQG76065.1 HlyD family efflux transporter periplasmic adaptor subunit [Bacteroidales bacterium]
MKAIPLSIIAVLLIAGCKSGPEEADAYGSFEALEITVSAETGGRILQFDPAEGADIEQGAGIALIDTTLLYLQKAELDAGMKSVRTRLVSINAQNDILAQQIENLKVNIDRTDNMLKEDAATRKQYDDLTGQVAVLQKQIDANNTQKASIAAELQVFESRKATLGEQIARSCVRSPVRGTLIEKYAEAGEITAAGKPLAKIADLSLMKLKVYVSGAQLPEIQTGKNCTVRIDHGKTGYRSFTGTVSYISGKAEFTPKIIQTKEERVTFVYAVIIEVKNDGSIKSGMPGEAIF